MLLRRGLGHLLHAEGLSERRKDAVGVIDGRAAGSDTDEITVDRDRDAISELQPLAPAKCQRQRDLALWVDAALDRLGCHTYLRWYVYLPLVVP